MHECGSSGFLGSSYRLANKGQAALRSTCPDIQLQCQWVKKQLTDTSTATVSNQSVWQAGLRVGRWPISFQYWFFLWRLCLSDIRANERCHVVEKYLSVKPVKPAYFHDAMQLDNIALRITYSLFWMNYLAVIYYWNKTVMDNIHHSVTVQEKVLNLNLW